MEPNFQTSFIPKKPLTEERVSAAPRVSIVGFLATIIFIVSLVAAGVVYFYKFTLAKSIDTMDAELSQIQKNFDRSLVDEMQRLDKRINAANTLLAGHIMISPIFRSLQDLTLKSIGYTKFSYALSSNDPTGKTRKIDVIMSGKAKRYDSIALQSDELVKNKYIKDPIFSNLVLDEIRGIVTFDLSFAVDQTFVNYEDTLLRNKAEANFLPTPTADTTTPTEVAPTEDTTLPADMMAPENDEPTAMPITQ